MLDRGINGRQPKSSQESSQVSEYIDVARTHGCEQDSEYNQHHTHGDKLAFQKWTNLPKPIKIDYYISNHDSQNAIETSRCACLDGVGTAESREYVTSDGCYYIYHNAPDCAKTVLKSGQENDGACKITKEVHEIDMQNSRSY